jgi:succinate dehydrogenase/fumarate reductase flavoprotein subunit
MNDGLSKREDDSSSNFLTRTTIREANNHLQMLHTRNQELEELVHKQNEEFQRKDFEYKKLFKTNQFLDKQCQQLQMLLDDRTRRLHIYEKKEVLFRETLELKPAIESLLDVLNTFEKQDSISRINPLQFIQSSSKNQNSDVSHKTDAV